MTQIIRIGDSYERTFTFYAPAAGSTAALPVPDLENPIHLGGVAISFVIAGDYLKKIYSGPGAVTVTAAEGKIEIFLSSAETALFKRCKTGKSYLNFDYGDGRIISKVWENIAFETK